jgi:hypothetical protein
MITIPIVMTLPIPKQRELPIRSDFVKGDFIIFCFLGCKEKR